jgi:minor extracellular serine protease Vpr
VVTVAGLSSEVAYSGLAPGLIGLYQINFRIPAGAPTGPQDVVVTLRGAASNTARIAIR